MKFSAIGRSHLAESFSEIRQGELCTKQSVQYLRPKVRAVLLKIAGGERIPPEFIRIVLSGCLKVGSLKADVFTIPSKAEGLRIQTSDIILGEPGVGKGQAFQQRDSLLSDVKKMLLKYADDEFKESLLPVQQEPLEENGNVPVVEPRAKFKYVDVVYRLCGMSLPFLVDLSLYTRISCIKYN